MSGATPNLHQFNLVVSDMAASIDFYRRLGLDMPSADEAAVPHTEVELPGGVTLELDGVESARLWHAGSRADPSSARAVIGFALDSRDAVDERYVALTGAATPVGSRRSTRSGAPATPSSPTPTATTSD